MPFVKKNEVVNASLRRPAGPANTDRQPVRRPVNPVSSPVPTAPSNEAVKSSLVSSNFPCVASGCESLDRVLAHGGIPLGSIILIEEGGTTDFSSILLRCFCAQGILHSRTHKNSGNFTVVVSNDPLYRTDLPGAATAVSKSNNITVENLSESTERPENLRIAWRYGRTNDPPSGSKTDSVPPMFDFTKRLFPPASPAELVQIACSDLSTLFKSLKQFVVSTISKDSSAVIRLAVPSFLSPIQYPPSASNNKDLIAFIMSMRKLIAEFPNNLVAFVALSLELYPRSMPIIRQVELLCDGVVELEPFLQKPAGGDQSMQGFVHLHKTPVLSLKGMNVSSKNEYAFRVSKRHFSIQEWSIPVDESEIEQKEDKHDF